MNMTRPIKKPFYLTILFFISTLSVANVYKSQIITSNPPPSDLSIVGDFLTNNNVHLYEHFIDSDNDGDLDKIEFSTTENSNLMAVKLYLNNGNDTYTESNQQFGEINLPNQTNIKLMDVYYQDLDGDGFKDLWFFTKSSVDLSQISTCDYSIDLSNIYKNNGDNNFTLVNSFYYESYRINPTKQKTIIQFEDINHDGLIDPVFYNLHYHSFPPEKLKLNNLGQFAFNFTPEASLPYVSQLKIVDINHDGIKDFITFVGGLEQCTIQTDAHNIMQDLNNVLWVADADGNYTHQETQLPIKDMTNIEEIDLNNDAKTDLFVTFNADKALNSRVYFANENGEYSDFHDLGSSLEHVKFADMNNDGMLDIVGFSDVDNSTTSNFVSIYTYQGDDTFDLDTTLPVTQHYELQLKDMDADGHVDIIVPSYLFLKEHMFTMYYNEGNSVYTQGDDIGHGYENYYVISDVNVDGLPDLVVSPTNGQKFIFKNEGNRVFEKIENQVNYQMGERFDPYLAVDTDANNTEEILGLSNREENGFRNYYLRILQRENNNKIHYYDTSDILLQSSRSVYGKYSPKIAVADFNDDGLLDVLVSGDNKIKLLTQENNPNIEDIYYDPNHTGHGFSLENIGRDNLYYNIFYSYNSSGNSEWYIQLSRLFSSNNTEQLLPLSYPKTLDVADEIINFKYDYLTESIYPNDNPAKKGFLNNKIVGSDDVLLDFSIDSLTESWDSQRLINSNNKPAQDFSGLWWAGYDDSGWGLSLNFVKTESDVSVFAVLYFYDANGDARWIVGQAEGFEPNQALTIPMNMINGYGRNQNFVELTDISAGTVTINLNTPSQDLTQSGSMSMNVHYPRGQRKDWIRDNIPFALFSKPRD